MLVAGAPEDRDAVAARVTAGVEDDNGRSVPHTEEAIQGILVAMAAAELGVRPEDIDVPASLIANGLDSLSALSLAAELEEQLGYRLPPTLLRDHPSITALAHHLAGTAPVAISDAAASEIPAEAYRIELFPEYRSLRQRMELGL